MILLNSFSCLDCTDIESHNQENIDIINKILSVCDYSCALICKYQDEAHRNLEQRIESCDLSSIFEYIESRDIKNGVDLLTDGEYLIFMLYGQNYTIQNKGTFIVAEAIKVMPFNSQRDFINVIEILYGNKPGVIKEKN